MSISLMAAIFDIETLGPTERLLLLALADHADDEGACFPSIARLARRTGLSERGVRGTLRKLETAGYVTAEMNAGRRGSNLYFVTANPGTTCPPERRAPRNDVPPPSAPRAPLPRHDVPPNLHLTIIEPSTVSVGARGDEEIAEAVAAYNAAAARAGWPQMQKLTAKRRAALKGRLKDAGGVTGWEVALAKAEESDFLTGQTENAFMANFDFLTNPTKFTRLMEGNYDRRTGKVSNGNGSGAGTSRGGRDAMLDEIAASVRLAEAQGERRS